MPDDIQSMFDDFASIRGESSLSESLPESKKDKQSFKEDDLYTCFYCQEDTLSNEEGILVCTSCGRESGNVISTEQEWRNGFDSQKVDPSRCGMPVHPLLPQASLGTVAQGYGRRGYRRLMMQSAMPSNERSLLDAINKIKSVANQLNIGASLADKACYLYSEVTKNVILKRGKVRSGLMGYCQEVVCGKPESGCYVTMEQLASAHGITTKKYNEGRTLFCNLSFYKSSSEDKNKKWSDEFKLSRQEFIKPTDPENIAKNACRKMRFTDEQIAEVTYMLRNIKKLKLASSKMPQSVAAGCLILYVKERNIKNSLATESKIAELCIVSDPTAKSTYKTLSVAKKYIIPKKNDVTTGKINSCMPKIQLDKIYTAPRRANPRTVYLPSSDIKPKSNRGRPKIIEDNEKRIKDIYIKV